MRNQAVQTPARSESLTPQLLEVSPRKEEEQEVATSCAESLLVSSV